MDPDIAAGVVGDDDGELGFCFGVVEGGVLGLDEGWEEREEREDSNAHSLRREHHGDEAQRIQFLR